MFTTTSSKKGPSWLLFPGLLAAVTASSALAYLQATYGDVPQDSSMSGAALSVFAGVLGAFNGFFAILVYATLIWIYDKVFYRPSSGFVQILSVTALAIGAAVLVRFAVSGLEFAVTGTMPTTPVTNIARYSDPSLGGLNLSNLVILVIMFAGAKNHLGYNTIGASVLSLLVFIINAASMALTQTPT